MCIGVPYRNMFLTLKLDSDKHFILARPKSTVFKFGNLGQICSGTSSKLLSAKLRYRIDDKPSNVSAFNNLQN